VPYTRTEVRAAMTKAAAAGRDVKGLHADARDTEIALERWGFLPVDGSRVDDRVASWYVAQGLAARVDSESDVSPANKQTVPLVAGLSQHTDAALLAAEAALTAAQAALALARSVRSA
jgi:hypothetical protein